jgi:predicted transcriptional regulator
MKTGRPKKNSKKIPISGRIDSELYKAVQEMAETQKRTISQIVEFAVESYVPRAVVVKISKAK